MSYPNSAYWRGALALGLVFTVGCPDTDGGDPSLTPPLSTPTESPNEGGPIYVGSSGNIDFGEVNLGGTPGDGSLVISNEGDEVLTVSSTLSTGSDVMFAIVEDVTAVDPGASATLTLSYSPSALGPETGALYLLTNDPGNIEVLVNLSGTGLQADADGDGSPEGEDCDDNDPAAYPGADEICDSIDNDCDTEIDEGTDPQPYYADADGDGFGDPNDSEVTCAPEEGDVLDDSDCDDDNASAYPGAVEVPYDSIDQDCDGEDLVDVDGDGVDYLTDCVDTDGTIYPGADETPYDNIDQDCDGSDLGDVDGDGYCSLYVLGEDGAPLLNEDGSFVLYDANPDESQLDGALYAPGLCVNPQGDCDDANAFTYPGASEDGADGDRETSDGLPGDELDNDCDTLVDEDTLNSDDDRDGYCEAGYPVEFRLSPGEPAPNAPPSEMLKACNDDPSDDPFYQVTIEGETFDRNYQGSCVCYSDQDGDGIPDIVPEADLTDCTDEDAAINPGAEEACDGIDNDCDTEVDEGLTGTFYTDADGDGYGDDLTATTGCDVEGLVELGGDCDDEDPATSPGADEACDGEDNDCDGAADEDLTGTYYLDFDGDGYGDPSASQEGCASEDYVDNSADCADDDAAINPDALEICDELDNNCDGVADEDVTTGYYADLDGDGYGDPEALTQSCEPLADSALNGDDCDDSRGDINPDAVELCDGVDNNCDGSIDDPSSEDAGVWYLDNDGDSFGVDSTVTACTRPLGYAALEGDCDDTRPAVNPGAEEVCGDEVDNNCDGEVDEDSAPGAGTFYFDADGDGFGVDEEPTRACEAPEGYVAQGGDCDDESVDYYPGAPEEDCTDPEDYNCDGSTAFADEDGDSFPACEDCDDNNDTVRPNAPEICDELDNNCNGVIDEGVLDTFYIDNDGDGFGALYNSVQACEVPAGYAENGGDCNDFNGNISPGSSELCDEIDNNCNGLVDEGLEEVSVYPDLDGDTHGATGSRPLSTCLGDSDGDGVGDEPPYGYALDDDDCDDSDVLVYTGAPERCDGEDNDCNGEADETCFEDCGGSWPFRLDYNYGTPRATLVDMNGDNQFEVTVQDAFGFAILGKDGVPYYNYSAPNHNYSRNWMVTADIDTYDSFTADTQGLEILTGNGSKPRFYKLNGDRTVTVYEHDLQVYDASQFMASDLDWDGDPEFLTTSWCQGDKGIMGFDYDRGAGAIRHLGNIPDPDLTCQYTDGRTLTDLDGDGRAEIVVGNGYGQAISPNVWSGQIYAFDILDTETMSWDYHCDPETCFPTDIDDLYGGNVGFLYRVGDRLQTSVRYFTENVSGAANPSTTAYWYYDTAGDPWEGSPEGGALEPLWPTDLDDDGIVESRSEVADRGFFDVDGDGYPDRVYTSGDEIRLGIYNPSTGAFDERVESRLSPSGQSLRLWSMWDSDGDGRLNVITADSGGNVFCHELGADSWNPYTSLPPHLSSNLRTNQWDNYEPNEGADLDGDTIPDEVITVSSSLTRYGNFYSYLTSADDVDAYRIDTGWSPNICLRAPRGRSYNLKVYSYRDRWNNDTLEPVADGVTDGLLWSRSTSDGGQVCFTSGSVTPPRNGEYQFIAVVESADGDSSPYWPYWISARK